MTKLPSRLKKPDAILVISAHWEEPAATLLGAKNPVMFYDYYGFPDKAYEIQYPAPGEPGLAREIADLLMRQNIPSGIDPVRGFDHGVFIPLNMMYPEADVPCLQLSLLSGLNPGEHIALGRPLRELNGENILVIGSGFSFHNMGAFQWQGASRLDRANDQFQDWLIEVCTGDAPQSDREQHLTEWEKHPSARYCHPREEHLLPLHVCLGMADRRGKVIFDDQILGKRSVGFLW
ncbi:MAG: class III extradiol ring-cleavage dioxygenase [Anaerolineaceae bacterium]